ncbi:cytochrome c oxidase assembly protein [Sphingosinicella rhizophila]|uniref:Cytochrome c oxidase assembly protein n=1 Tax=Sphingosinicella rhizophila TaxID=3050082 RepID=A0ABU3Q693_9SPHN|nr:cytochrome c oxidase assembly protein [Sphingosinicella sp. GR2756]MDT9598923.1 cytochrome c oxidase assembly protein [Sphingosinicella sp. GR2756]
MTGSRIWIPYCGAAPSPAEWLDRWNLDPALLLLLAALPFLYHRLRREPLRTRRACFAAAWFMLLLLFISPFCALASALFSVRVVHHVLLTAVLAPMIVSAFPRSQAPIFRPLAAWTAAQALIFWAWHSPDLYGQALSSDAIYWLMQASLLGSAAGFWSALRIASPPAAVAALLVTMVQMGLLGALLTFSGSPLYAPHLASTAIWGLSPLEDQQLAGLIMWAPSAGLYLAAALIICARWLRRHERLPLPS